MSSISFRRLSALAHYQFITSWRYLLVILIIYTVGFSLIQTFFAYNYFSFMLMIGEQTENLTTSLANSTDYATIVFWIIFAQFPFFAADLQRGALTKQERSQMLLLPATMTEKFLVRFFRVVVVIPILLLVALFLSDFVRMALAPLFNLPLYAPLFIPIVSNFFKTTSLHTSSYYPYFFIIGTYLVSHAFYTMSGCFFRKHTVLFSFLSQQVVGIGLWIFFAIIFLFIPEKPFVRINYYGSFIERHGELFTYCLIVFLFLLAMAEYYIAYRLFTRQQFLGRTLINL